MKNFAVIFLCIAVFYSCVVSTYILCNGFPRIYGLDYVGLIVGIVALLVTILMAWNIFSVVDINKKSQKMNASLKESELLKSNINNIRNECQAALFYLQGNIRINMTSCHKHLFTYYVYQTSLWYALMQETDFSIGLTASVIDEMDRLIKRIKTDNEIDVTIGYIELEQLKNNMNDIITSGNKSFSRVQREQFITITNEIRKLL